MTQTARAVDRYASIGIAGSTIPKTAMDLAAKEPSEPGDIRFRMLLGTAQWQDLPAAVRRRFSKRLCDGATVIYAGRLTEMRRNRAGRTLAGALRLVGAPLPLSDDIGAASVISVTEGAATGGQIWTRLYANATAFPQIVHSSKRFSGPTGLEEYVGCGISMALRLSVSDGALVFHSAGYSLRVGGARIALPTWLHPGRLTVRHRDLGAGCFEFALTLRHPTFGELLHQVGIYRDGNVGGKVSA